MQIVILDDFEGIFKQSPSIQELEQEHQVVIYHTKAKNEAELVERLKKAEFIIPIRERTKFTRTVLQSLPHLKLISQTGTGLAHIDLEAAREHGIAICNMPGTSSNSVAEFTFALIFSCLRSIQQHALTMHKGEWVQTHGQELKGKRLGLVGFGPIGQDVARIAKVFDTEIIVWSPSFSTERAQEYGVKYAPLDTLISEADIVSIHLRAVPELHHIVSRERLLTMKQGAILINTSRAMLVDMSAALELLQSGHLHSAAFDVFDIEPLPANDPLLQLPNVVLTPHIGWVTEENLAEFARKASENIKRFILKEPISTLIN